MLEENLKTNSNVSSAINRCDELIKLAKKMHEHVIHLIIGYGSTGGSHKINIAIYNHLEELLLKKQIKGYAKGTLDFTDPNYLKMPYKELIDEKARKRGNLGTVFVVF